MSGNLLYIKDDSCHLRLSSRRFVNGTEALKEGHLWIKCICWCTLWEFIQFLLTLFKEVWEQRRCLPGFMINISRRAVFSCWCAGTGDFSTAVEEQAHLPSDYVLLGCTTLNTLLLSWKRLWHHLAGSDNSWSADQIVPFVGDTWARHGRKRTVRRHGTPWTPVNSCHVNKPLDV